jgi:parvulin-like peptidyl-prolyl isomerase
LGFIVELDFMRNAKLLILLTVLLLTGCADKPQFSPEEIAQMPLAKRDGLPEPSGGFALVVGEQSITADEVIAPVFERLSQTAMRYDFETFRQLATPIIEQQLVNRISDALLYSRAKSDAGENVKDELDRVTTAEVKRFVMDFGGDYAKAEQALKRMGMDWEKFQQYQRRKILSQSYIAQKMPDRDQPVSYSEMLAVYNETKDKLYSTPASLQFRLIDIEPAKLKVADNIDANAPREEQAKALAYMIIERLNKGEEFAGLAKEYSQGPRASKGGLWRKLDPESLASPYDVLEATAAKMKPGDVAGPVEKEGHIFIMQLVEFTPKSVEPFEKVQNQVKADITIERMRKAYDKINDELLQQASAADRDRFVDFCVLEIYRMVNK